MIYSMITNAFLMLVVLIWLPACNDSSFGGSGSSTSTQTSSNDTSNITADNNTDQSGTSPSGSNSITSANNTANNGTNSTTTVANTPKTTQQLCQSKVAVALVMDVSGSMGDVPGGSANGDILGQILGGMTGSSKIALAITSAEAFLSKFTKNPGDMVGLVEFSKTATILSPLTADVPSVVSIVTAMAPETTTSVYDGLVKAAQVLLPVDNDTNYAKFIVLMSDGMNNEPGDPVQIATSIKKAGVTIFTVGFTSSAGASQLQTIATGPAYFINAADGSGLANAFNTIASQLCR